MAHPDDTAGETGTAAPPIPTLEDWQHWTSVMGRAQQMLLERWAEGLNAAEPARSATALPDPMALLSASAEAWSKGLAAWGQMLGAGQAAASRPDRRFAAPEWHDNPLFDTIRQSYLAISAQLMKGTEELEGLDDAARARMKFATQSFLDAMSPSNFALTNPLVLKRTMETRGENLLAGLRHMLDDINAGQLSHTSEDAFEVGRNLATTPGKVIHETAL